MLEIGRLRKFTQQRATLTLVIHAFDDACYSEQYSERHTANAKCVNDQFEKY